MLSKNITGGGGKIVTNSKSQEWVVDVNCSAFYFQIYELFSKYVSFKVA